MKVGFTGTRHGMTLVQRQRLRQRLIELTATELHHGDCIGADAQANFIARELNIRTIGHPPFDAAKRAFTLCDEWRLAAPYLIRNMHIVNECAILLIAPRSSQQELRSGTWATYRYARGLHRPFEILLP